MVALPVNVWFTNWVWVSVQRRDEKEEACLASPLFFIVVELFVALAWNTSFIFGISMVIEDLRVASLSFRGLFNHSSCRVTLDCSDVCWFFCPTFLQESDEVGTTLVHW